MVINWNSKDGYVRTTAAETNLKTILGIPQLDYTLDPEMLLAPYFTPILEYLVEKLIILGVKSDMKIILKEMFRIFDYGSDKIIHDRSLDLATECGVFKGVTSDSVIEYKCDRFVFAWTNLLSTLILRLRLQYGYLLEQETSTGCCNIKGQGTKDFESWKSNVYPDDEPYDRTNYFRPSTAWGVGPDQLCGCHRRKD